MSHIAKHKVEIKGFDMELMKQAINASEKELEKYIANCHIRFEKDYVVISGSSLYRNIVISKDGEMQYDSMNAQRAKTVEKVIDKYYLMVVAIASLKKMGYIVKQNIAQNGEIQILGESL